MLKLTLLFLTIGVFFVSAASFLSDQTESIKPNDASATEPQSVNPYYEIINRAQPAVPIDGTRLQPRNRYLQ